MGGASPPSGADERAECAEAPRDVPRSGERAKGSRGARRHARRAEGTSDAEARAEEANERSARSAEARIVPALGGGAETASILERDGEWRMAGNGARRR
jgi:hypothetical protein